MSNLMLPARLLLAAVFAIAGAAKLLDREGSRRSARAFGVPAALAPMFAVVLPVAELLCAAALVPARSAAWGAAGALALLSIFVIAIAVNRAIGRRPDCHCFGQLHSSPAGPSTLIRNIVLAGIAATIMWPEALVASGVSRTMNEVAQGFSPAIVVLSVAVLAIWTFALVAFYHILKQNGRMLRRLDAIEAKLGIDEQQPEPEPAGLPVDSAAPDFRLARLDGGTATLDMLSGEGKPVLLFFTEPNCGACDAMLPDVAKWQHDHADRVLVVPIGRGDVQANRVKARAQALHGVLLQKDSEVAEAFHAYRTPSAVLLTGGRVSSKLAVGPDAIRALVKTATTPPPLKKGERVPSLRLRDLNGGTADLASLDARATLVLFWNPSCGFCQAMLDDVKAWERNRADDAPSLLVVSSGSPKVNREQGFRSRVLLDSNFSAGNAFGAEGTPAAVLIDARGNVASDVGVGAAAVLALAGTAPIRETLSA
jgi:peroxiredoxin/uncharacterized membrane protein YphA (DoxX/SURF4 family)